LAHGAPCAIIGAVVTEIGGPILVILLPELRAHNAIERNLMAEIGIPAAEGIGCVAGSNELLELKQVVEAHQVFEESGLDAKTLGRLKICRLMSKTGGRSFAEE
jgi:hypothetical protein